ncbi:MAG: hypothetical protein WD407_10685 [Rhodospirillales bacterium]
MKTSPCPGWNGIIVSRIEVPRGPGFDTRLDWDMVNAYRLN